MVHISLILVISIQKVDVHLNGEESQFMIQNRETSRVKQEKKERNKRILEMQMAFKEIKKKEEEKNDEAKNDEEMNKSES